MLTSKQSAEATNQYAGTSKAQPVMDTPVVSQPRPATPANCPPVATTYGWSTARGYTPAKPKADVQAQPVVTPRQEAEVQLEQAAATGANTDKPKAALENNQAGLTLNKTPLIWSSSAVAVTNVATLRPKPGCGRPAFDYSKFRDELTGVRDSRSRPGLKGTPIGSIPAVKNNKRESIPDFLNANRRNNERPIDSSRREPIWKQLQSICKSSKQTFTSTSSSTEIATVINQLRRGNDRPVVSRPR